MSQIHMNESCRTYLGCILEAGGNMAQITASNDSEHALQGSCVAVCCGCIVAALNDDIGIYDSFIRVT